MKKNAQRNHVVDQGGVPRAYGSVGHGAVHKMNILHLVALLGSVDCLA